ncbi:TPA: hypothetical protein QDB06_000514 [Burkholderia vietnamiensis]|nr:hypothetical protein [Burkholderia vietnamiensis]
MISNESSSLNAPPSISWSIFDTPTTLPARSIMSDPRLFFAENKESQDSTTAPAVARAENNMAAIKKIYRITISPSTLPASKVSLQCKVELFYHEI